MNYLLDTHTFIWTILESDRLSLNSEQVISDRNNEINISTVSFWEISLKVRLKKFVLEGIDIKTFPRLAVEIGFNILPLGSEDAITYNYLGLKRNHKDPFDRMLIWQAIKGNLIMISKDKMFEQYKKDGLRLIW